MAFKKGNIYTDANKTNGIYPNTVFSAVYTDDMSATLGDVASYSATTLVSGVNPIEIGIDMDLLWENASPTSSFAAQTISLDLSNYRGIYVIALAVKADSNSYLNDIFLKKGIKISFARNTSGQANFPTVGTAVFAARPYTFQDSGIDIGDCYFAYDSWMYALDNGYLVPYKIYGIR